MAPNPNPSRVSDSMWWLWEQLHAMEPTSQLGGIYAFKSGYHSTLQDNRANWPRDYSINEAPDQGGRTDRSSAIDWTFPEAQSGNFARIELYTKRLLASAKDPNDPRLDGWREFYGNANGDGYVDGWDTRHGYTATSDDSHLWHLHMSETRSLSESMDNKIAILSVLRGETVAQWREGDMALTQEDINNVANAVFDRMTKLAAPEEIANAVANGSVNKGYLNGHEKPGENGYAVGSSYKYNLRLMTEMLLGIASHVGAPATITITDAQANVIGDRIASRVVDNLDNPLTEADVPVIKAAVKAALSEGTGD